MLDAVLGPHSHIFLRSKALYQASRKIYLTGGYQGWWGQLWGLGRCCPKSTNAQLQDE